MGEFNLKEEEFLIFKDLVYKESGICFNNVNKMVLESRIESAMKVKSLKNIIDFYNILLSNKEELNSFLDLITTNLTKFFRIESHFKVLKDTILPSVIKRKSIKEPIRIWSAGCSTGEEPYSIAMTALETQGIREDNIRIYASDISLNSLLIAKEGVYKAEKLESVQKEYLKYFEEISKGEYSVKKNIKDMITFDYHNLRHKGPHKNMDIIFCRNVMIYFDAASQKLTIDKFYDILDNHGYLFIGHSESLFGMGVRFKFNNINGAIFYTKEVN